MAKRSREDSPPPPPLDQYSSSPSPSESGTPYSPPQINATHSSKYQQVTEETARSSIAMKCSLAPHPDTITFTTFEDFEIHYAQAHTNRCSECQKNFPTDHFLGLHIHENHDPLVAARKARDEKTYQCFVEGCDKICSTPQKRKMHLQAKHLFPKDYDFYIVNDGIDRRSSMLRSRHRRGSSAASRALCRGQRTGAQEQIQSSRTGMERTSEPTGEEHSDISPQSLAQRGLSPASSTLSTPNVDELASTLSAMKFVPTSVRFGRGGRATGLGRR
ncbi:MAG: hypothetical protein Q9220_004571 [cf. Caloplaca sp. 1 TL-2023]